MKKKRVSFLMILDVMCIVMAYALALYLRFDGKIESRYLYTLVDNIAVIIVIKLLIFYAFNLYRSLWKYASVDEMIEVVGASVIANLLVMIYMSYSKADLPRSIYVMVPLIDMALIGGSRFTYRIFKRVGFGALNGESDEKRVLIVGAGEAGAMVIKELRNHKTLNSRPVAIVDDNPSKKRQHINGVPVLGNRKDIKKICEKKNIDEIIISIPSANRKDLKDIVNQCKKTKCKTKIVPGYYELIDGKVNVTKIRDVEIEDLLGREEVKLNMEKICHYIEGKKVLITGGGGSIGSELCRQVVRFNPKELIILDIYENNAYDIQNELLREYRNLNLKVIIASVRDRQRLEEIFSKEDIDVVFHAAAHKHVPLMEENPKEAIKNNVFGTWNLVKVVDQYQVDKFVLISTDKAVNPTNVMGATKRVAEMIIQTANRNSNTEYVAVRFGNVLGSNGSVIPLFKHQIKAGGPVTVTHPEVIRYFMTIPEACQLVLQAGGMAKGGEIFILDMGEPVKIIDLAKDLIRLSGFEPGKDIAIEITGLRPGEKLYEELLLNKEESVTTDHQKIYIEKPLFYDYRKMKHNLCRLKETIDYADEHMIKEVLAEIVPTYKPYNGGGKIKDNTVVEISNLSETAMTAETTRIN
ncbi:MAG: polysaccharide biosynthesis protein [Tissierellia bacterium]|nr:polysaccharide biosynthesis protein [Tissierellia bacterium]